MPFKLLFPKKVQVRFTRTIVGWFNVCLVDQPDQSSVNISPDSFFDILPKVSAKARLGCGEITSEQAEGLFGENLKEVRIA